MLTSEELEKHETAIRKVLVDAGATAAWNSLNRLMEEVDETRNLESMLINALEYIDEVRNYGYGYTDVQLSEDVEKWWTPRVAAVGRKKEIEKLKRQIEHLESLDRETQL